MGERRTLVEELFPRRALRGALPTGVVVIADPLEGPVCPEYPHIELSEAKDYASYALEAARIVTDGPNWKT